MNMFVKWFLGCSTHSMADNLDDFNKLNSYNTCKNNCGCVNTLFQPVCDSVLNYLSPCHAGCTKGKNVAGKFEYSGCSCALNGKVTEGYCYSECSSLKPFMAITTFDQLLVLAKRVGENLILLRCVDQKDKSFALGFTISITILFGKFLNEIILFFMVNFYFTHQYSCDSFTDNLCSSCGFSLLHLAGSMR